MCELLFSILLTQYYSAQLTSGVTRNFFGRVTPGIFFGGLGQKFFRGLNQEFFGGVTSGTFFGGLTNSVEDRGQTERGSEGGSPPPLNLQISKTRILIRLLWLYFPRNWEFGSALSKLRNFGGRRG
jgi:hypothetical protein